MTRTALTRGGMPPSREALAPPMTAFLLGLWCVALHWSHTALLPRPFDDVKNMLFYVGGIGFLYWQRHHHRHEKFPRHIRWLFIAYGVVAAVSVWWNGLAQYEGLLELSRLAVWGGCIWGFTHLTQRQVVWLVRISVCSAGGIAGIALLQYFGVPLLPTYGPLIAPLGHLTYFSHVMALNLAMAVWLLAFGHSHRERWGWGGAATLLYAGLWVAGTRSSLLAVLVAGGVFIVMAWRYRWLSTRALLRWGGGILLAAAATAILLHGSLRGESLVQRLTSTVTNFATDLPFATGSRWNGYVDTWRMTQQRPLFGWGLETFRFTFPSFEDPHSPWRRASLTAWYMHPHNEVLHQLADVGVGGTLLWLLIVLAAGRRGLRQLAHPTHRPMAALGLALWGILLLDWQFSTNYLMPLSRWYAALALGLLVRSHDISNDTGITMPTTCCRRYAVIAGLAVLVALHGSHTASLYCLRTVGRLDDPAAAASWIHRAYRFAPGSYDATVLHTSLLLNAAPSTTVAPLIDRLYRSYPTVPMVLYLTAKFRIAQGEAAAAESLLASALRIAPEYLAAQQLLTSIQTGR